MRDRYRAHADAAIEQGTQPLVWGIGSAPDDFGHWQYPLVVANDDALRADGTVIAAGRYVWAGLQAYVAPENRVRSLLASWDIPPQTFVDVSGRPTAAGKVYSTDEVLTGPPASGTATVGLPCELVGSGDRAFITAGHLVTGKGVRVDVAATGDSGLSWVHGTVVQWADPATAGAAGGYDYAVVRLDNPMDSTAIVAHRGPTRPPRPPYQPLGVVVYGGPSGTRRGTVTGALAQLGDTQRQWLNVWQFGPSGMLYRGDSGSLAMVTQGPGGGSLLGHFVGGAGTAPSFFDHQYIQDFQSCLAAGLAQYISI